MSAGGSLVQGLYRKVLHGASTHRLQGVLPLRRKQWLLCIDNAPRAENNRDAGYQERIKIQVVKRSVLPLYMTVLKLETKCNFISLGFINGLSSKQVGCPMCEPRTVHKMTNSHSPSVVVEKLRYCSMERTSARSQSPSPDYTRNRLLNEYIFRMSIIDRDGIVPF